MHGITNNAYFKIAIMLPGSIAALLLPHIPNELITQLCLPLLGPATAIYFIATAQNTNSRNVTINFGINASIVCYLATFIFSILSIIEPTLSANKASALSIITVTCLNTITMAVLCLTPANKTYINQTP
ncbi:hypothetical protein [Photobacterium leiognathi]|uniref:hypothetical protein n=1 Tax=Photobacterium leiognathi TaxID=553611 RepID=UPI00298297DD|nr:hypothetical protein [Photobacterium leiognathi]